MWNPNAKGSWKLLVYVCTFVCWKQLFVTQDIEEKIQMRRQEREAEFNALRRELLQSDTSQHKRIVALDSSSLLDAVKKGKISRQDVLQAYQAAVSSLDSIIYSYISIFAPIPCFSSWIPTCNYHLLIQYFQWAYLENFICDPCYFPLFSSIYAPWLSASF